jgi:allantoicase
MPPMATTPPTAAAPEFTNLADLASARVGGRAIATNDDFFASKAGLVKAEPAVWIPDKYTPRGKWMDGWESRRRRIPGHDWCIVQLGMRGVVHGVDVDTSFFTGNFPSHCSIEAVDMSSAPRSAVHAVEGPPWTTILGKTELRGNSSNFIAVSDRRPWTHVRLSIYPDGGVARLRVYGEVSVDWDRVAPKGKLVDLASIKNGGLFLAASDTHYGTRGALLMPDRAKNMGDGWETKRSRDLSHRDWAIVRLGTTGIVSKVEIDTNHYKGNYPDRASLEGVYAPNVFAGNLAGMEWSTIVAETKLSANKRHFYSGKAIESTGPFSHVRLNIFPDGGVSRLRIHGRPSHA